MESNNNLFEELEKELVENADEILIRESNEVILPEACGFAVVLILAGEEVVASGTSFVISSKHYLFLKHCSLLI